MGNTITVKTKRPTIRDLAEGQCFRMGIEPNGPGGWVDDERTPFDSNQLFMRVNDRFDSDDLSRCDPVDTRAVRLSDGLVVSWLDATEVDAVFDLDIKATER